jgi:hypothetical protein
LGDDPTSSEFDSGEVLVFEESVHRLPGDPEFLGDLFGGEEFR